MTIFHTPVAPIVRDVGPLTLNIDGAEAEPNEVTVKGSVLLLYPALFTTETLYVLNVRTCVPNPVSRAGTVKETERPSEEFRLAMTPVPKRTELPVAVNPEPKTVTTVPIPPEAALRNEITGAEIAYGFGLTPQL